MSDKVDVWLGTGINPCFRLPPQFSFISLAIGEIATPVSTSSSRLGRIKEVSLREVSLHAFPPDVALPFEML
jgi:hypothetical protein